jgi:multidrug resistance efflux pump
MSQAPSLPALGFQPQAFTAPKAARAAPLPKRPKGRWFVGLLLAGTLGFAGHHVWSSYFRYRAYGTVTCKTVEVSPPWDAVVSFVHRRQGDRVRQGDLLMTVQNLELSHRSAQIADELKVEQAKLEAEAARIKWEAAYSLDQNRGALATYYEVFGTLLLEEAKLEDHANALARVAKPEARGTVSKETVDKLRLAKQGQESRIAMLKESLAELKRRADEAEILLRNGKELSVALLDHSREQLKPIVARMAALHAERTRVHERLAQGEIRAPVNGTVLKHLHQVGESCKASAPLVSLLDESSLQVVLFLDQKDTAAFKPGASLELQFDPYDQPLHCTLVRLGDEFEPAPEQIKRHYREGQELLPAYLEPDGDDERWMALRRNGVVKLSRATPGGIRLAKP